MTRRSGTSTHEAQIRRLIEEWAEALRAKDIKRLWPHYAPDLVVFDLAPPLHHGQELRKELEQWFKTWNGPIGLEIRDLVISAGSDIAFSHSLQRMHGPRTNGEVTNIWVRATTCFRRGDGAWKITHEHTSVPFYMDGSYRAAVDLKPSPSQGGKK